MRAAVLRRLLAEPRTRDLDLDDPATTALRRDIVRRKPFLRDIYRDWYRALASAVEGHRPVVELGSGPGFLDEIIPGCVRSEVFVTPGVQLVFDARALPFGRRAVGALVMTNVFHHIPEPYRFLQQAADAVHVGGVIAMIEPWRSAWSSVVYTRLHHEPFVADADPNVAIAGGPLSGANGALPWIVFDRDRAALAQRAPAWELQRVEPMMPFRYLVSGGVSMRALMPGWTTPIWRRIESRFAPRMRTWAMFALIVLRRRG